jgi:FkbM family methyltransferase
MTTALSRRMLDLFEEGGRLVVVDCGARYGGEASRWQVLGDRVRILGFEPDPGECRALEAKARGEGIEARYFPYLVAGTTQRRAFHQKHSPTLWSLYETDPAYTARLRGTPGTRDVSLADRMKVERTFEVETVSLNDWAAREGIDDVDFIKVDVEGAELEVLDGAGPVLDAAIGVQVDVAFQPLGPQYPLFREIDALLSARGFQLFDLPRIGRVGRLASPIVREESGQALVADALYLRDPLRAESPELPVEKWVKLVALAAQVGQIEFGFEIARWLAENLTDPNSRAMIEAIVREATTELG